MKKYLMTTLGILFCFGAVASAGAVELKDDTAKISYSLGYQIGGDFKKQKVSIDSAAVIQGIQDALDAKEPALSEQEMNSLLVSLKQKVVAVAQRESIRSSKEFLAENIKKPGVKELPGGGQYKIMKAGSGDSPTLEDTVDIHYDARRADGTKIASTRTEKNPIPYQVKKLLPGLQKALLLMKPGAKWEIFVPPSGRGEAMERGGVLIYELELFAIHPATGTTK